MTSPAVAALQWDVGSLLWDTDGCFANARSAIDDARADGLPVETWATWTRTLEAARDEYPPDVDLARSLWILALSWDEPGGEDTLGREWSEAKDSVAAAVERAGSIGASVVGESLTLVWAGLLVVGLVAVAYLVKGARS